MCATFPIPGFHTTYHFTDRHQDLGRHRIVRRNTTGAGARDVVAPPRSPRSVVVAPEPRVRYICPCGKRFRLLASLGGRSAWCLRCGRPFVVPTAVSSADRGAVA